MGHINIPNPQSCHPRVQNTASGGSNAYARPLLLKLSRRNLASRSDLDEADRDTAPLSARTKFRSDLDEATDRDAPPSVWIKLAMVALK